MPRERERDGTDARVPWRVERETPTMDTDTAMRWTRRSASRDADGCLWAGYGWTSENESDKTFILFARRATLLQSSATGLPPASRIGRVEARHRCLPHPARSACATSFQKKRKTACCACNGPVLKVEKRQPRAPVPSPPQAAYVICYLEPPGSESLRNADFCSEGRRLRSVF